MKALRCRQYFVISRTINVATCSLGVYKCAQNRHVSSRSGFDARKAVPSCSGSGHQVTEDTSCLIDADLDLQNRFQKMDALMSCLAARRQQLNVQHLHAQYVRLTELQRQKSQLEAQREEIADIMKLVVRQPKSDQTEAEKALLISKGREARVKLKQLLDGGYRTLEKEVMNAALRLPVDLHESTPTEDIVMKEIGAKPEFAFPVRNHIDIGRSDGSLKFSAVSSGAYYMYAELALLEQRLTWRVSDWLRKQGLHQLTPPDMVKAFVAQGCDMTMNEVNILEGKAATAHGTDAESGDMDALSQTLVLSGVSCMGFAAYLAALTVNQNDLPLKLFSVGTGYTPEHISNIGLYSVRQSMNADIFGACRHDGEADDVFDEFTSLTEGFYKTLDLPYRFVRVGAPNLRHMESRRIDVSLWSPGFQQYLKCGELRSCRDFISRRLGTRYAENINDISSHNYVHTVHGTVLRIPAVLASYIEHHQVENGKTRLRKLLER